MNIFVDPLRDYDAAAVAPAARRHGGRWCHLVAAGGDADLDTFAARIGLRPAWAQNRGDPLSHYDLTPGKRAAAVRAGAIEVAWRSLGLLTIAKVSVNHGQADAVAATVLGGECPVHPQPPPGDWTPSAADGPSLLSCRGGEWTAEVPVDCPPELVELLLHDGNGARFRVLIVVFEPVAATTTTKRAHEPLPLFD